MEDGVNQMLVSHTGVLRPKHRAVSQDPNLKKKIINKSYNKVSVDQMVNKVEVIGLAIIVSLLIF